MNRREFLQRSSVLAGAAYLNAPAFAEALRTLGNPNLIIYYSCDDMTPIPSRNKKSGNKDMPVNAYRSMLFTHIFDTYMSSHQVSGVNNTTIRLDNYENGIGYSLFFHFIARDEHRDIVEMLKEDIWDVSGK